jgi:acetyl esterase
MQPHPKLKELLDAPADPDATPVEEMAPDAARAEFDAALGSVDGEKPPIHAVRDIEVPGPGGAIVVRLYEPTPAEGLRSLLVYFHGGGYIRGNIGTHDSSCRILANTSGCLIASVEYRLSPEARFPDAIEDCFAATRWLFDNATTIGADPERLAVGGDSAGGNMACAVTLMARDAGGPAIKFQLLIFPNTDMKADNPSMRAFSKGYWLDSMPFYVASYLRSEADIENPLASPLRAPDLSNLPPAYLITAGFDPLHDEGEAYAERLKAAGVAVETRCYDDMIHGFTLLRTILDEADEVVAACGEALKRGLGA